MGAMERHLSEIYTAQQTCPAMVDAIMLFRVWARQREIEQVYMCIYTLSYSICRSDTMYIHTVCIRDVHIQYAYIYIYIYTSK